MALASEILLETLCKSVWASTNFPHFFFAASTFVFLSSRASYSVHHVQQFWDAHKNFSLSKCWFRTIVAPGMM